MLDVRRLRLLHQLAAYGTITATAEALCLTGPAVSQQLAVLEREAGVPLLEKHGRTRTLTDAGRLLVSHAEVLLGDLAAAEADLASLRGDGPGTVRLAAFPSAARTLLPLAWPALAADPANAVSLRLVEQEPGESIGSLARGEVDLAVVHSYTVLPRVLPADCEQHPLLREPVLLVLPPDAAERAGLAAGEPATLARFAELPWLLPQPGVSCHELVQRACGAAGFVPNPVATATDFAVLVALVAAGAGAALVPRMALPHGLGDVRVHPLAEPVTRTVFALTVAGTARRPDLRRTLSALAAAATGYAGALDGPAAGGGPAVAPAAI